MIGKVEFFQQRGSLGKAGSTERAIEAKVRKWKKGDWAIRKSSISSVTGDLDTRRQGDQICFSERYVLPNDSLEHVLANIRRPGMHSENYFNVSPVNDRDLKMEGATWIR